MKNNHGKSNRLAFVVDAYGPARSYAAYFRKHGVLCAHIQSRRNLLPALTPVDLSVFDGQVVHDGDIDTTMAALRATARGQNAEIVCVIAGVEPGVLLADALSEALELVTNGTRKSVSRRNKFMMAEIIEAHGIPIPAYFKSANLADLIRFAESHGSWPLVMKPLDSAGSNGVYICKNVAEVCRSFELIIGKTNNMGRINEEILVQSFLDGPEFMVNTVSCNGHHYVSDIWHNHKIFMPGRGFIYDRNDLIPSSRHDAVALAAYTVQVLDALGIRNGPAHAEVIMTDEGPRLVEIGARINGLIDPEYSDQLLGHNQIALSVQAYVDPDQFLVKRDSYRLKRNGTQVCLISKVNGKVADIPFLEQLADIESLYNFSLKIRQGGEIAETVDLSSCPGVCNLIHDQISILNQDCEKIREKFAFGVRLVH